MRVLGCRRLSRVRAALRAAQSAGAPPPRADHLVVVLRHPDVQPLAAAAARRGLLQPHAVRRDHALRHLVAAEQVLLHHAGAPLAAARPALDLRAEGEAQRVAPRRAARRAERK